MTRLSMLWISDRTSSRCMRLWATEHCQAEGKDACILWVQEVRIPIWATEPHLSHRKGCSRAKSTQKWLAVWGPWVKRAECYLGASSRKEGVQSHTEASDLVSALIHFGQSDPEFPTVLAQPWLPLDSSLLQG